MPETAIIILSGALTVVLCVVIAVGARKAVDPCWFQCPLCHRYFTDTGERRHWDDPPTAIVNRLLCADCAAKRDAEERAMMLAHNDGNSLKGLSPTTGAPDTSLTPSFRSSFRHTL